MTFNYYYGSESEAFSFFRLPKMLIQDKRFASLKSDSKLLYGIMLDRMSLSQKNSWLDEENRVYIIFTVKNITEEFNCSERKAIMLLSELEKTRLIEKRRQGQGLPNIIYVNNIFSASEQLDKEEEVPKHEPEQPRRSESHTSLEDKNSNDEKSTKKPVNKGKTEKKETTLSPGEVNRFQKCKNMHIKTCKNVHIKTCKILQVKKCKILQVKTCKDVHPSNTEIIKTKKSIKDTLVLKDISSREAKYEPWFSPDSPEVRLSKQFIAQLQEDELPNEKYPQSGEAFDSWVTPISQLLRSGYTEKQISDTLLYLKQDHFWSPQVRDTKKFKIEFNRLYLKSQSPKETASASKNTFKNFTQREYDMDELSKTLIL